MAGRKVGGVQKRRSHVGHVGVQVRRFDPENKAVRVGEAESKIVAVTRQQLFVICTVHDEFAEFKYREADCEWTIHHYSRTRLLHENQVGIYDRAALERGFARGRYEFLRIAHESRIDALSQILASLAEKTVRQQFVQRGLEFGFGVLTLLVAVFDKRPHEWALSERHDPVRAHEPHSVRQIEFQTAVVGDVKRLVAEVGNKLVARDVFAADELVHFFQGGAEKAGFHRQMFGKERIYRVSIVQMLGLFEVDFKNVSPIRLIAHRIHVERIDFGLSQKSEIADRKTE